jgi:hypothetical protein
MTYLRKTNVQASDSASIDSFGRWRVSTVDTLFDSKLIHDAQPLFWDDQQTSGGGTSSSHSTSAARVAMSVSDTTAGTRVRQTYQRWPYQPGKSQFYAMTFANFDCSTGITKRVGAFDSNNGIFLQNAEGTVSVVIRSSSTGSAVDTAIAQANWNVDPMDGSGPSGVTMDWTKAQILIIDFQWLGVGRVRFGFDVDGVLYYVHEFLHANSVTGVYMSTPNLPLRYELTNSGSGGADTFDHICGSVGSEAGFNSKGVIHNYRTTGVANLSSDTEYAIIGVRLKSTHLDGRVELARVGMASSTANELGEWHLLLNPTIAGAYTFADVANTSVQTFQGIAANTVSGGTRIAGGYFTSGTPIVGAFVNELSLGAKIDGTRDVLVLSCIPITNNVTVRGQINWREQE